MAQRDYWCGPTLLLWGVFFALGISPEAAFEQLRIVAHVTTQHAMTNSPWLLFWGLVVYYGYFTYRRCQEAGLPAVEQEGKTLQVILLSLAAFYPIQPELLFQVPYAHLRYVVIGVFSTKALAWLYLFSILLRYYLFSGQNVYVRMFSLFPSVRHTASESAAEETPPALKPVQPPATVSSYSDLAPPSADSDPPAAGM